MPSYSSCVGCCWEIHFSLAAPKILRQKLKGGRRLGKGQIKMSKWLKGHDPCWLGSGLQQEAHSSTSGRTSPDYFPTRATCTSKGQVLNPHIFPFFSWLCVHTLEHICESKIQQMKYAQKNQSRIYRQGRNHFFFWKTWTIATLSGKKKERERSFQWPIMEM